MWKPPIETQTLVSHIQSCCPFFQSDLVNKHEAKKIVSFKTDVWKWREFWGKSEFHRIFSSTLDIVAYHIWAFLVAARGSRSRGHFWYLARCRISVFSNSSFGRCKIIQFGHNLGRDLHIVFAFVTKYWRWVHFPFALLLVVLWNFIPVKCQRRSPQTRLGLKKYFSSACSIVSKCAVWAHWVVWAKSYNIQRNNATKTFTVKACMFMNRENKFNLAMHMLLACPYYQW